MSYDDNNVFAKMLRGEIPAIKVYEDAHTLAFMDIMPQAEGHTLVIPKEPAVTLMELSDEGAAHWIKTAKKIATAVKKAFDAPGVVLFQLNGTGAGQSVPHIHFHVLPGSISDLRKPHASVQADPARLQKHADSIREALASL
ncbi:MAG: HIT family protein [Saccharospirillum sp.]